MAVALQVRVACVLSAAPADVQVILEVDCPSDAVKDVITVHGDELRACYERRLDQPPAVSGTAVLEWTVGADGTITPPMPNPIRAKLDDPGVRDCVVERIRTWVFPTQAAPVDVTLAVGLVPEPAAGALSPREKAAIARDKIAMRKVIAAHSAEVLQCYEAQLVDDPTLAGKVVMRWTVSPRRFADHIAVWEGTTIADHALLQCIKERIATWRFPAPAGGLVTITYPWILRSSPVP